MLTRTEAPVSLESGDHRTREEFHRRYLADPRRNGVLESVVWHVLDEAIDWFRLKDGQYVPVEPGSDGVVEREQFPGLRLHVPSMLAGDLAAVLAALHDSKAQRQS